MSIVSRLITLVAVPLAVLIGLGVGATVQLGRIEERSRFVAETQVGSLSALGSICRRFPEMRVIVRGPFLTEDRAQQAQFRAALEAGDVELTRELDVYADTLVSDDKDRRFLASFRAAKVEFFDGARTAMDLVAAGRREEASALLLGDLADVAVRINDVSDEWIRHNETLASEAGRASVQAIEQSRRNLAIAIGLALALTSALGVHTGLRIANPIRGLRRAVEAIAAGDYAVAVPSTQARDETGDLARSIEILKQGAASMDAQRWVKAQTAEILGAVQRAETTEVFASNVLSFLVPMLDGGYGAFYLLDAQTGRFGWAGGYGAEAGGRGASFEAGEGLSGQVAVDGKMRVLSDVPGDYVRITSALGEARVGALVVLPVAVGERVVAVVEIAAFRVPSAKERGLLADVAPILALNLEVLQRNLGTQALLEKTREQADALATRERDLRQVNVQSDSALELTQSGYWHVPLDGSGGYTLSARSVAIFGVPARPDHRYRLGEWFESARAGDAAAAERRRDAFEAAVNGTVGQYEATYAVRRPADGKVIWVHDLGSIVRDPEGRALEVFGVSQDVSAFKRLEGDLLGAKDAAESATRTKSDFLANMSHEIRTPMNAVIGLAHLALKTQLTSKQRDYLSKIHNAGTSLLGIINDILDFSKIEAGRLDIERTELDLDKVMSGVTTLVGQKAHDKGLELLVGVAADVPNDLVGDPLRLGQVITNLVSNAVKFTDRGEVRVRVTAVEKTGEKVKLRFSVEDTGMGMTREQSARLFQPFTQADTSTTRKHGGTGLGLTISKRIVELMGGQIGLESEPGVGTTFYFSVWLGVDTARGKRGILPTEMSHLRALVVDDNPAAREILSDALHGVVARVDVVTSGEEALAAVEAQDATEPFDVVFMDWRMPGMDGLTATARIKDHPTLVNTPHVIMVTAFGRDEVREEAEKLAVDAFLLKPVTRSMVVDSLVAIFAPAAAEIAQASAAATGAGLRLDGARILLAEDNAINQQIAVELLEGVGAKVTVADNGRIAVEVLEREADREAYHLVLMDLQMPEMDGHQATARIRSDPRWGDLPIIAMTAHATLEERQRCLDEGMVDHVSKPIDPDVLFRTVRKYFVPTAAIAAPPPPAAPPPAAGPDLPALPGLDARDGLARLAGNRKLYDKLLLQFAVEQREAASRVGSLLAAGDRAGAERLAHTVKGVAGNLGAKEIQAAAAKLEHALSTQGPPAEVEALRADFGRWLEALLVPLAATLAPVPARPPVASGAAPVDPTRAAAVLEQIRKQLSEFDAAAADAVQANRDLLAALLPPGGLEALEKAVESYAFDEAQAELDRASLTGHPGS